MRCGFSNLFSEHFDFLVEHGSTLAFLLFHLDFVLITISMFTLAITGLIELDIGGFPEELDVL